MDHRYTGDVLRHLEKQNELLMDAYNSMSHEVQKLQVEEEMLMRKFYEFMSAQGLVKKNEDGNNIVDGESRQSKELAIIASNEGENNILDGDENGPSNEDTNNTMDFDENIPGTEERKDVQNVQSRVLANLTGNEDW